MEERTNGTTAKPTKRMKGGIEMRTLTLITVSFFLVALAGPNLADWIDNIAFEPTDPTESDSVSITVSGTFSCINTRLVDHSYAIEGQIVSIEIISLQPIICLTAIGPWDVTEEVGLLSAGHYSVVATLRDTSGVIHDSKSSSFSVSGAGLTVTSRGCVVSRYSPICQSGACSFYLEPDPGYEGCWLCDFSIDGFCVALNLYQFEGCHVEVTGRPGWCSVECGALIVDSLIVLNPPVALSVQDTFGMSGDTIAIDISLINPQNIEELQFTIEDEKGWLIPLDVLLTDRTAGWAIETEDNLSVMSILIYSPNQAVLEPGDNPIVQILFEISPYAVLCDSTAIEVSDPLFLDENGESQCISAESGRFLPWYCSTIIKGDLNPDCGLDIVDVVLLVNYILEIDEPLLYPWCILDCDEDGMVDIQDVLYIVNCILGLGECGP